MTGAVAATLFALAAAGLAVAASVAVAGHDDERDLDEYDDWERLR